MHFHNVITYLLKIPLEISEHLIKWRYQAPLCCTFRMLPRGPRPHLCVRVALWSSAETVPGSGACVEGRTPVVCDPVALQRVAQRVTLKKRVWLQHGRWSVWSQALSCPALLPRPAWQPRPVPAAAASCWPCVQRKGTLGPRGRVQ